MAEPSPRRYDVMIPPAEARRRVIAAAEPRASRRVPLLDALGLVLAEPIAADRNQPPFRRAMMDGFAVRLSAAGRTLPVAGEQPAGPTRPLAVGDEACVEVMTGAACPPGTEAVVQKEHARREGECVVLPPDIRPGQHIAEEGSECRAGAVVLRPGDVIGPVDIAAMAAFGVATVAVTPRPGVQIIATGGELALDGPPRPGEIRDTNGPMLAALASAAGLARTPVVAVHDDLRQIAAALAAAEGDLVVLSGGVSVGRYDLVPAALQQHGAEILFHKVVQKPGKPLLVARRDARLYFALPGNPLACYLCFCRYVRAAIRAMSGRPQPAPLVGELTSAVRPDRGRTLLLPAMVEPGTGRWRLEPLPGVSSADIFHAHGANACALVPPGDVDLPAGAVLDFERLEESP